MRITDWSSDVCSSDLQPLDLAIVRVKPGLDEPLDRNLVAPASPARVGEPRGHILAEAERLADLANRAARTVVDDGRGDPRAVATIAVIDMLDHLLAPLMLEIDVDVGRLVALGRHEAREEQFVLHRVDRGDAEQEADDRIGG